MNSDSGGAASIDKPDEDVVVQEVGEKTIFDMNLETEGNDEDVAYFENVVWKFNTKAMGLFNTG